MFDTIKHAHINTGLGGRDKKVRALLRYANVTRVTVKLFKFLSSVSKKRKRCTTKGVTVKPILPKDFGS